MEIADAHVHYFSRGFFEKLRVEDVRGRLGWDPPSEDLATIWTNELDRHGVSQAVLIASIPGDDFSVAQAVREYPDRFYGYFMVDPTHEEGLLRTFAGLDEGLHGVCFFPAMHRYSMHDNSVIEVLERVNRIPGTVAFVHCGVLSVGVRKKLGMPSKFDMRFSNPLDLHSIALEFDQVPFVIPHFGAGYFREALMLCDMCPNVYLDTSSSNSWIRYLTPEITLRDVFKRALDVVGPSRLLFGSDSSFFPRGWNRLIFDEQYQVLQDLGVSAENTGRILGGNLRDLLRR